MNVYHLSTMWSSIIIFILTFAILGILLGFSSIFNSTAGRQNKNIALQGNVSISNMTESTQPNNNNSRAAK